MNLLKTYEQIDKLNKMPINQVAKRYLLMTDQKPDPDGGLYIYQLMEWALANGILEFHDPTGRRTSSGMLEFIQSIMGIGGNPQRAMDFLTKEGPDEGDPTATWVDPREFLKMGTPEDAASYLIDCLFQALIDKEPSDRVGDGYD